MRAVIQRVSEASVGTGDQTRGRIGHGSLVLLGIEEADTPEDAAWLAAKVVNMRIFSDVNGQMNTDLKSIDGDMLVISQFTLHAMTRKGNRPSFIRAARPEKAQPLYEKFIELAGALLEKEIQTGEFGAHMKVSLVNDGPVTIFIDSRNRE